MDTHDDNLTNTSPNSSAGDKDAREIKLAAIRAAYLADLPQQIDILTSLLEKRDFAGVKKHAHRIKGTSGTYRLNAIADVMETVERLAVREDTVSIQDALESLTEITRGLAHQARQAYEALVEERGK